MLKNLECGLYDAEFSVIKKNHRFNSDIFKTNQNQEVQECLHGCTIHPNCYSANYKHDGKVCEFVSATTATFRKKNVENLLSAIGWTYFDTKDKNSVSAISFLCKLCFLFLYNFNYL